MIDPVMRIMLYLCLGMNLWLIRDSLKMRTRAKELLKSANECFNSAMGLYENAVDDTMHEWKLFMGIKAGDENQPVSTENGNDNT